MKIFVFISCDSVAFTKECLNGPLAGRGNPPLCPMFAAANPGSGSIPMVQSVIDVSEYADCYENQNGKWVPVKEDYQAFTDRKVSDMKFMDVRNAATFSERLAITKAAHMSERIQITKVAQESKA